MRIKKIAYNEHVDDFGNVRKGFGKKNSIDRAGYGLIYSLIEFMASIIWWIMKMIFKGIGMILEAAVKNIKADWGKSKPIIYSWDDLKGNKKKIN